MVLILECSRPAVIWGKPEYYSVDREAGIVWAWFAIRWLKVPYHRFVMEKEEGVAPYSWGKGGKKIIHSLKEIEEKYGI